MFFAGRRFGLFVVCWLLLLQMLNLSLNPARHINIIGGQATYREDLRINQIESICEFVLEFVLDVDVPENQDTDDDPAGKILFACLVTAAFVYAVPEQPLIIVHRSGYNARLPQYIENRESPPPEQVVHRVCLPIRRAG